MKQTIASAILLVTLSIQSVHADAFQGETDFIAEFNDGSKEMMDLLTNRSRLHRSVILTEKLIEQTKNSNDSQKDLIIGDLEKNLIILKKMLKKHNNLVKLYETHNQKFLGALTDEATANHWGSFARFTAKKGVHVLVGTIAFFITAGLLKAIGCKLDASNHKFWAMVFGYEPPAAPAK